MQTEGRAQARSLSKLSNLGSLYRFGVEDISADDLEIGCATRALWAPFVLMGSPRARSSRAKQNIPEFSPLAQGGRLSQRRHCAQHFPFRAELISSNRERRNRSDGDLHDIGCAHSK